MSQPVPLGRSAPAGTQDRAEQGRGADGFQRPLRSRFPPRLTPSVRQVVRID